MWTIRNKLEFIHPHPSTKKTQENVLNLKAITSLRAIKAPYFIVIRARRCGTLLISIVFTTVTIESYGATVTHFSIRRVNLLGVVSTAPITVKVDIGVGLRAGRLRL